ncbi:hypothetical protein G3T36_02530 [Diaminobutyricibacter tongyongensis]|uniref:Uncharacterized protein n=1 Tax=Leifsonia tongyongensis TaxID=1268043 RepID=A0A6L9XTV0_9MICO|nr:hypothetical protein [Diaminobutyricibacter tongyongensis]NEN04736.1 hypothetical protein [Diaminobutyricibacter tongyongensis]
MTTFMQRVRRVVYGNADPSNVSDAIHSVGQIGLLGHPADPEPFRGNVTESAELDPDELPWELRGDDKENDTSV